MYVCFFFNPPFKYRADFSVFESGVKNYIIMGNGIAKRFYGVQHVTEQTSVCINGNVEHAKNFNIVARMTICWKSAGNIVRSNFIESLFQYFFLYILFNNSY